MSTFKASISGACSENIIFQRRVYDIMNPSRSVKKDNGHKWKEGRVLFVQTILLKN